MSETENDERKDYFKIYNRLEYVRAKHRERAKTPKRIKDLFYRHLLKSYNLTFEDYTNMLIEQSGRCKICENAMMNKREPHVDHCHVSGKVRSLLCFTCNLLIANAKEDINILNKAINYLKTYPSVEGELF